MALRVCPDETGRRVPNPISLISRWKILDNLRRSMVEPATLALFLLGWTALPGRPLYWTLITLGVLFLPLFFQFGAGLVRAGAAGSFAMVRGACGSLATGLIGVLLRLVFLGHDALVSTDAIWRSLYRRLISRQRLLEWETAAEAELGAKRRTPVDLYLAATPALALTTGLGIFFARNRALWDALPVLSLWGCSKLISLWLDRPPGAARSATSKRNERFLRRAALRTWRYFAVFSREEHNWLIPDNVQEDLSVQPAKDTRAGSSGRVQIAPRVSPTNLGFLLNARQMACEARLSHRPRIGGANPPDPAYHDLLATSPRTSAQLVRHADPIADRSQVCFQC